jgi:hypothetical protein
MSCSVESEIQALGRNAPRITPMDIEKNIVQEWYFTAEEGVAGSAGGPAQLSALIRDGHVGEPSSHLSRVTFCVLVLTNGFVVTGSSAAVSLEGFDKDIGRQVARNNAIDQVWPLMGYALREQLHNQD